MDKHSVEIVRLLLEVAPAVFALPHLALKGGTALNLFIEDLPRLSVDIDVAFTDHTAPRPAALKFLSGALATARQRLEQAGLEAALASRPDGEEFKLFVRRGRSQVKVEVNQVFRGTLLPVEIRRLSGAAREFFTTELSVPVLAAPELYGGKLVAALDRQHPRDLFDVRGLFAADGLSPAIVECFVGYLAGHHRPVHEVLFSRDRDLSLAFQNEFQGLPRVPVTLADLAEARRRLRHELAAALTPGQRQFLLGLVSLAPDWSLMQCPHLRELPAIQWKLRNLATLKNSNPRKFAEQSEQLRRQFAG